MTLHLTLPLSTVTAAEPEPDTDAEPRRLIAGLALPWDTEATVSTGQRVQFARGSVSLADAPVVLHHMPDRPVGIVVNESLTDEALTAEARISATRDGDEALVLAQDRVLRGWSVGVEPTEFTEDDAGLMTVTAARADHLALVMTPAFTEARVTEVAASAAQPEGGAVTDTATTEQEAPAMVAAAPRTPSVAAAGLPTMGEWMQATTEQRKDPERFAAVQARIQAAAGHITSTNLDNWAETPYVGQVIDYAQPAARPLSVALGISAAPSGVKSFLRPTVSGHLAEAAVIAEKGDATDDGLTAGLDQTVTMTFIKRAANVSAEAQAFSSPDVYALVGRDLVRSYLLGFEYQVVTALAGVSGNGTATIAADGSDAVGALATAAGSISANVFSMPDLCVMAPDVWAKFAGWTATDGRALFPYLNPENASGSNVGGLTSMSLNVLGLRPVVVPTLAAGACYLMASSTFEVYESSRVSMGPVQDPTVLGTAWGIGGAVGTNVTDPTGIVKVTVTP